MHGIVLCGLSSFPCSSVGGNCWVNKSRSHIMYGSRPVSLERLFSWPLYRHISGSLLLPFSVLCCRRGCRQDAKFWGKRDKKSVSRSYVGQTLDSRVLGRSSLNTDYLGFKWFVYLSLILSLNEIELWCTTIFYRRTPRRWWMDCLHRTSKRD